MDRTVQRIYTAPGDSNARFPVTPRFSRVLRVLSFEVFFSGHKKLPGFLFDLRVNSLCQTTIFRGMDINIFLAVPHPHFWNVPRLPHFLGELTGLAIVLPIGKSL